MSSLPVVERHDVFADLFDCLFSGAIPSMMSQFHFKCAEEDLHRHVIPAVPLATHRRLHLELLHQLLITV